MNTSEVLAKAVAIEENAAKQYREFADVAKKENMAEVADLFEELARVKDLHADILSGTDAEASSGGGCGGGCGCGEGGCSGNCANGGCSNSQEVAMEDNEEEDCADDECGTKESCGGCPLS